MKLVYEYSKNIKKEKDMFNSLFTTKYNILSKLSSDFYKNFDFYSKIIKNFFSFLNLSKKEKLWILFFYRNCKKVNCKFISRENKIILKAFKHPK